MVLAISVLVFILTGALVLLIGFYVTDRSQSAEERLRGMFPTWEKTQVAQRPGAQRSDLMPTITRLMRGGRFSDVLMTELSSAGLPVRPSEFVGMGFALFIALQLAAMLAWKSTLAHVLFAVVGIGAPIVILKHLREKRRVAFEHQIADSLVMMASSLRSGFSFLRAMQMVAHEMPPPIAVEFQRVVNEVNVGRPLEDSLRSVVSRVHSYDFDLVVTAVLIQQQVGGNLADILGTIAETMRERARVIGEVQSLTAEGRISGVVLVLMPIFLGICMSVMNPSYMSVLIYEPIGHYLIGMAVGLQILGGLIIRKMLQLDF